MERHPTRAFRVRLSLGHCAFGGVQVPREHRLVEVDEFPEPFNIRRNESQQRRHAGGTELAHRGLGNGSNSNRSRTALWIAVKESLLDFRVLVTRAILNGIRLGQTRKRLGLERAVVARILTYTRSTAPSATFAECPSRGPFATSAPGTVGRREAESSELHVGTADAGSVLGDLSLDFLIVGRPVENGMKKWVYRHIFQEV